MTTATTTVPAPTGPGGGPRPVPFSRLVAVELRKQTDTRAGRWLLAVVVLLGAGLIVVHLLVAEPADLTWQELTMTASFGQVLLLPLLGIMAATAEWSQRTALTTFVLEPRRTRVHLAKLAAAGALAVVVTAAAAAAGAVANVVGMLWRDGAGGWALDGGVAAGNALAFLLLVAQGVAFGLALLSTPAAIVAYLALPTGWSVLGMLVPRLSEPAQWLDMNRTLLPLMTGELTAQQAAQLATSVAVWVAVPLAVGLWRTARREVS
ncbi:ABC transporter permease [Georgenia thermotolerans]|uniref:ABC transporter permease n=1 Tax=Georgenia thermotolerans TaxID=527326 RepID=A0A7J5UQM3_9MICO|nr:ABC transporter permease [Georgenia thermotolerans]KAE8764716.1 ABC transporter permease [Georgenia thermotolerans]